MNFIIKAIHGCNLSCIYCFEQPQNKRNRAMRLDEATSFLQKVHDYYARANPDEILGFHWHGGEPMLQGAEFFEKIIAFQKRVFGDTARWFNTIQSNLTLLDDAFIRLLTRHPEHLRLGISFDFFGNARVDKQNRDVNALVWSNLKRVRDTGIPISLITMLTKSNVRHIDEIYDLVRFEDLTIRFNQVFGAPRRRPFHRPPVRLRNSQYCAALQRLTHRWINDSECSFIMDNAERIMMKIINPDSTRMCWYEKSCLEDHMAVCPDGTVFPCDVFYFKEFSYGNIFRDEYEELLASEPRRLLLGSQMKARPGCEGCDYFLYCYGGCPMRAMFSMPAEDRRLGKGFRFARDPLCATHRGMFEMIGTYLAQQGLVGKDWMRRSLPLSR